MPGAWWWAYRASDAVKDVWARHVLRVCCERPPAGSGGYGHWRCGRRRRHPGPHRFVNYTWEDGGRAVYDPVSAGFMSRDRVNEPRRHGAPPAHPRGRQ